jgi:hypothetical protein
MSLSFLECVCKYTGNGFKFIIIGIIIVIVILLFEGTR